MAGFTREKFADKEASLSSPDREREQELNNDGVPLPIDAAAEKKLVRKLDLCVRTILEARPILIS
jgi:hypothetical protein